MLDGAVCAAFRRAVTMWIIFSYLCVYATAQAYVINAIITEQTQITCWTCPNKTDNNACNDWAPEKFCPLNHTICQTRHFVNVRTGRSIRVLKQCAQPKECTHGMIGCHNTDTPGVQECISCCNFAYCNELVPTNHTTAILYSSLPVNGAGLNTAPSTLTMILVLLTLTFTLTSSYTYW